MSGGFDRRHHCYSHMSVMRDIGDLCCLYVYIDWTWTFHDFYIAILFIRLERVTVRHVDLVAMFLFHFAVELMQA